MISFPTGIVGPALAGMLAEHGAEVIAIEASRSVRSPQRGQKFQIAADLESNRDRKRIVVDMKHPDGVALVKRLIAKSDVVVENFSARVMASWGMDYRAPERGPARYHHGESASVSARPARAVNT